MDWNEIKAEYIAGGRETSYRKLAEDYGVPFSTLKEHARREKWTELREKARHEADTKFANLIGKNQAKHSAKIDKVADKLLQKIEDTLDEMEFLSSQSLKHFTSALKDIKDIKGIKSELDLKEQNARIDKLRKDIESDKVDDEKPSGVVMMPPIMDDLTPPSEDDDNG